MGFTEVTYLNVGLWTEERLYKILRELSGERRKRAEECSRLEDKKLSAGAGYLLGQAFKKHRVKEDALCYGEHGKPYLKGGEIFFNLSHSGEYAVCAVSSEEVGVDVQRITSFSEGVFRKVCTEEERRRLSALSIEEQREEFFRLWTAKESVVKYYGKALFSSLREIETDFTGRAFVKDKGQPLCVRLYEYPLKGYKLTVCTEREERPLFEEVTAE